jgi:hypothetical protein
MNYKPSDAEAIFLTKKIAIQCLKTGSLRTLFDSEERLIPLNLETAI